VSIDIGTRHLIVVFNPAAGTGSDDSPDKKLAELMQQHGIKANLRPLSDEKGIASLAKDAKRDGSFAVVAAGGDGTVSAVASALAGSSVHLGILPTGTLNHFAKDLGIPLDVAEAAKVIANGAVRKVDIGEVNGRMFVNNSSLGMYPHIVRGRMKGQRLGRSKWVAFVWSLLAAVRRNQRLSVRLTSPDEAQITRRTPLVFVGNNRYQMSGLRIGSRSALDEGELAVYVVHENRRRSLVRMAIEGILGRLLKGRDFDFLSTRELWIESKRGTLQVAADGEVFTLSPPLHYRIHAQALDVIVPATDR
jgi:diacylglycerol kinase family enzyme